MKSHSWIFQLLLLPSILLPSLQCRADLPKETVKVGVIVPLTGDMALHGQEIQKSMDLALSMSPEKKNYDYRIIVEDNQLEAPKSVSAARKLLDIDKVDVVVTLWPPTASVVIPLTERAGKLQYTIAWDPDLARKSKFVLSHQVMVSDIARATLRQLRKEGVHKIAFLHMEEAGFNLGARYIKELAPTEGIELVADEAFNPNDMDFRSLIERVQTKNPDSYLVWSVMPSIDAIIKQIREKLPQAKIAGYLDYASDLKRIEGSTYISEMFASDSYAKEFSRHFGSEPISKGPNAFDIMNLVISAFESSPTRKLSADELKKFLLSQHDVHGAVGTFSIDSDGNSSYPPVIRQIENGKRSFIAFGGGGDSK